MSNRLSQLGILTLIAWCYTGVSFADNRMYHCEIGVQGGMGYYVGELAPHVFQSVS